MTAVVQRDGQNVHVWTDVHHLATNDNLCDEYVVSAKPTVMETTRDI